MRGEVFLGYARLMRPANLPTAAADILAGVAIVNALPEENDLFVHTFYILMASVFLYAGGVVLNDVFDLQTDTTERPERPIPSGLVSRNGAAIFGSVLLLAGIILAYLSSPVSALIASFLAVSILLYDAVAKHNVFFGPLVMGLCRSLNLLMAMSIIGMDFLLTWHYALIPLFYIFAITLISRGEVHGNNKSHLIFSMVLYALVISGIIFLMPKQSNPPVLLVFLAAFAYMIYKPLITAYMDNSPGNIKRAVISGVLGLILMDAAMAAGYSPWWYAVLIILLLPVSMTLSKVFAVT